MNKYESDSFSREDRVAKIERDKRFNAFRDIVLNNKDYALGKAREILDELVPEEARRLFEMFNEQEGALPDNLASEYIKLVYGPENLMFKMGEGLSFYEAVAKIAQEIKFLHIELNPELVNHELKITQKIIEKEEAEADKIE